MFQDIILKELIEYQFFEIPIMKEEKKDELKYEFNKCIEILVLDLAVGKILYSCGNPRESRKIFYDVHFIEYAIYKHCKKVSFYFGVGKRLEIVV